MEPLLTGLKPTGELTLGNYIGAIKPLMELSKNYDNVFLFVADLHALTIPQDPQELKKRIRDFVTMYIACGIDLDKTTIYVQSDNEYMGAISWMLECATYYGEASRMIQFKEKSKEQNNNFTVGLLTYPVLMATDILYCDSKYVPVGIDQKQHVELARDIAIRFNNRYGETFTIPEPVIRENGAKIMDLKNPEKKMSKSADSPNGVITMYDTDEEMRKKIMGATTDSEMLVKYDPENKPGISNLMTIVNSLTGESFEDIETKFQGKNYGEFKRYCADVVVNELGKIRDKFYEVQQSNIVDEVLDKGREITRKIAKEKYELIRERMGTIR